jgi:hypothetical protein
LRTSDVTKNEKVSPSKLKNFLRCVKGVGLAAAGLSYGTWLIGSNQRGWSWKLSRGFFFASG